jgi:hypothetical protein
MSYRRAAVTTGSRYAASTRAALTLVLAGGLLATSACDFGVTNPGRIDDDALNSEQALPTLVVGMGADLSRVVDDIGYFMGIASRDIWHTGAFEPEQFMQEGQIEPRHVNGLWSNMHTARWVAEHGIDRIRDVLGDGFNASPLATEAHVWAGYSNRVLGENVCFAIIDGGAPQDRSVHFQRAEEYFNTAITMAQSQGETDLLRAAYAGRAQVRLDQGNYAGAAEDAAKVPLDYHFQAKFSDNSSREWNWLANESHKRRYFTVWGTWAAEITDDPRVPWVDEGVLGVDGLSPFYRQDKYPEWSSDIDLSAGDEMRLIEAEALLRSNDVTGAVAKINEVRTAAGVPTVSADNTDDAWTALRTERNIVLWMEGRHLFELVRFNDPFLSNRGKCIPISQDEAATNPNVP